MEEEDSDVEPVQGEGFNVNLTVMGKPYDICGVCMYISKIFLKNPIIQDIYIIF